MILRQILFTRNPNPNPNPGAFLKFRPKGGALIGRRALNRGGRLKRNYQPVLIPLWLKLKKVMNKAEIETAFPCIPDIKKAREDGRGVLYSRENLFDIKDL